MRIPKIILYTAKNFVSYLLLILIAVCPFVFVIGGVLFILYLTHSIFAVIAFSIISTILFFAYDNALEELEDERSTFTIKLTNEKE